MAEGSLNTIFRIPATGLSMVHLGIIAGAGKNMKVEGNRSSTLRVLEEGRIKKQLGGVAFFVVNEVKK